MAQSSQFPSANLLPTQPTQPDKFYSGVPASFGQGAPFVYHEVKATPVAELADKGDFQVHQFIKLDGKRSSKWVVSEGRTGSHVTVPRPSKEAAIQAAVERLGSYTKESMTQLCQDLYDKNPENLSPRYRPLPPTLEGQLAKAVELVKQGHSVLFVPPTSASAETIARLGRELGTAVGYPHTQVPAHSPVSLAEYLNRPTDLAVLVLERPPSAMEFDAVRQHLDCDGTCPLAFVTPNSFPAALEARLLVVAG